MRHECALGAALARDLGPVHGQRSPQRPEHKMLALAAGVAEPVPATTLEAQLKKELWDVLAAQRPSQTWSDEAPLLLPSQPPLKRSRTLESLQLSLVDKTEQLRMSLGNKIASRRMVQTLVDAQRVLGQKYGTGQEDVARVLDDFFSRTTLDRHALVLDAALDAWQLGEWARRRAADPEGWALAVATDESPPSQARVGGLRFQVTLVYAPLWRPESTWDDSPDPPLDTESYMADVCHCLGKDGPTVMAVLDKQLMRVATPRYDVCNVVGDGGGENEGGAGIHATMEADVPGYVRRRCLGHMAWRTADALLNEWEQHSDIKALCSYLCDGITWSRIQALATTPLLEGGLGLFREMSQEHKAVFGTAPGGIVEGRPESVYNFLVFLRGKEHVLHLVCARDIAERRLAKSTREAVGLLGDVQGRAERSVCAEVLQRTLYLHRWVNTHSHIANVMSLPELLAKAEASIQDMSLDDFVIERLGTSREAIDARPWTPSSWVEEAVWQVYQDHGLTTEVLPALLGLHKSLVSRAQAHLSLTMHNVLRTSWLAASLLHRDPGVAQEGANKLLEHLLQTAPARRTPFEKGPGGQRHVHGEHTGVCQRGAALPTVAASGCLQTVVSVPGLALLACP